MDPVVSEEMSPWASRRKTLILIGAVLVMAGTAFLIFWKFWYRVPSCFDNLKNGDETGVDCGGSCVKVCSGDALPLIVRWDPRLFEVSPGLWSVLVYVENPNPDFDATYVPYTLTIYGGNNRVLLERQGATILPKGRTEGVFEGSISLPNGEKPERAAFELGKVIWKKNESKQNDGLSLTHSELLNLDTAPKVTATVKNNSINEIKNIELVIAVFDGSDNAIAASRTFVENLKKNQSANVVFTWPRSFELGKVACDKPSDIVLAIDRSGSMQSQKINPPEPLTSVKNAASNFTSLLNGSDSVGLVSFATDAKTESGLKNDFNYVESLINGISVGKNNTQYTNISDALNLSLNILAGTDADRQKIIILLTDGVATRPVAPGLKTEAEEIAYAENEAMKTADVVKQSGSTIYTIGLGQGVNTDFLKKIASSPDDFFEAPSTTTLQSIYQSISSDICTEVPARIEITYKIFGSSI